jgi:gamma-glutamylcyclotransferase (GGCT)/AIG2-like uncharacterized protein YtfP
MSNHQPASICPFVVVYGSLKRDQSNHQWLAGARFRGSAQLVGAELYSLGSYPMAVLQPGSSSRIRGEVFQVDGPALEQLDLLEGHPHYYRRVVLTLSDGCQAWVYLGTEEQVAGKPLVHRGDWGARPVFSYGSNMDPSQLRLRCLDWDGSGLVARLDGWRWGINKRADAGHGQGFAGIVPEAGADCWGVVHYLSPRDLRRLDRSEGVGGGHYRHQQVTVLLQSGKKLETLAYVPCREFLEEGLQASRDYGRRILTGAAHWELGSDWCQSLRASLLMTA